jgi:hypothetical protein
MDMLNKQRVYKYNSPWYRHDIFPECLAPKLIILQVVFPSTPLCCKGQHRQIHFELWEEGVVRQGHRTG